jgi:hypothetical protein
MCVKCGLTSHMPVLVQTHTQGQTDTHTHTHTHTGTYIIDT